MPKHRSLSLVSKHQNETNNFISYLSNTHTKSGSYRELADKLNITYATLHNSFKSNRITYTLGKQLLTLNLSEDEKKSLNRLMLPIELR